MKTIKILALCLMASLGLYSCGSDKSEDPQPQPAPVQEIDIRDSFIGIYSGNLAISYLLTDTNQEEEGAYENYKIRVRKNSKDKNSIDIYHMDDGEEYLFFTARLTETMNEEGVTAAMGVIDRQYNEDWEYSLYGLSFDNGNPDMSIMFLGNTIGYGVGFIDNIPVDDWRYNIKFFYNGTKY